MREYECVNIDMIFCGDTFIIKIDYYGFICFFTYIKSSVTAVKLQMSVVKLGSNVGLKLLRNFYGIARVNG